MKLIVGLGNPGKEYQNTRHNIGFLFLDYLVGKVKWQKKFNAEIYETEISGQKVMFLKPQTYMNLSGSAIQEVLKYYKIDLKDMLVIHDDLDEELGKFKIKTESGSGGNNGIKSIISHLKTEKFNRIKIGISNDKSISTKDFVLSRFGKKEIELLENVFSNSAQVVSEFITNDINKAMDKYSMVLNNGEE